MILYLLHAEGTTIVEGFMTGRLNFAIISLCCCLSNLSISCLGASKVGFPFNMFGNAHKRLVVLMEKRINC